MMKNLLRSKKIGIFLIVLAWLLVSMGINADAATFTASATGNWSAAATWTNANVNRTGTVSCSTVSTAVVGTGTLFTTELSVGSVIQRQNGTTIGTVASISDDTNLTLTGNAANTTSGSYRISDGPGGAIDDVTINNGITVTVNIANALCNTITTINTGGITISGTNSLTVTGLISMARPSSNSTNFTIAVGAGTLTAGSLTMSSTTTTRNNIISISTGAVTINGAVTTGTTGCQFNFTGAGILDFHGTFTSSPTITTFAGSTVIYSNAGIQTVRATTYRNLTISGSGTKTLAAATPTISGVLTVKAGTTLDLSSFALGGTTAPSSVVLEIGSTGSIISGSGALNLGGDIIVNNITGNSGATISCPVQLDADRTFTIADNGTTASELTISGVISTGFGLTKDGSGTLTLSGVNTYTGATTISAGTLALDATGTIAASSGVANSGTLTIAASKTIDSMTGSGGTTLGANTLTIGDANNTTCTYTGVASGTGGITKAGTGTLTLSGVNIYTGATTINAGILEISAAERIDNSSDIVFGGGTLSTGASTGFSETVGTLDLAAHSTIALGTGVHTLTFANSSAEAWTSNTMLTITGWAGAYNGASSGTAGKIFIGSSVSGLSAIQLAQIQFFDGTSNNPAVILSSGEVVASREVPSGLSYTTPNTFIINTAITNLSPTVTGVVTLYGVSPALPAGLSLNTTTGVISGTPTIVAAAADYTVTASNSVGSTTFPIRITVVNTILTFYSRATGNWTANTTWSFTSGGAAVGAGIYPQDIDIVNIVGGFNVTLTTDAACGSITFTATTTTSLILGAFTLNVSGAIIIPRALNGSINTLAIDAGTLNAGSISFINGGSGVRHKITISTGIVFVTGDITTDNTGASASIIFTDAGTLNVGGQLMSSGTVGGTLTTVAGSTINYNGAAQIVKPATYAGNLTLSGTGVKTTIGITVNGILSMEGTATASAVPTYGSASTLKYNTSISRTAGVEWKNLLVASGGIIIDNTGVISLNSNETCGASTPLTVKDGATLNLSTFTLSSPSSVIVENGTYGSTITGTGLLTLGGNVTVNYTGSGNAGATISCPVALGATRTFTVADDGTASDDFTISNVISTAFGITKAGSGTMTLSGTNTFTGGVLLDNGTLNINNSRALGTIAGTFTIGGTGNAVTLNNTSGSAITTLDYPIAWNRDFTFTGTNDLNLGTGTVTLNANRQASVSSGTLTLGGTVSGSSYGLTKAGAGELSLDANMATLHDLTISNGTFTSTSGILNLSGTIENSGTFNHNNGTVNLNGSSAQTISGLTYYNIAASNAAGVSLAGNTTLNGTLTLTIGTLSVGSNTLTFQNSDTPILKLLGTITTAENSNLVFGTSGNTVGSAFTIPTSTFTSSPSLNNLTINRTNSLTWNEQMLSMKGVLLCSNGTFNTNGNLTLLSTASQTALIDGAGSGSVDGNVSMQRYIASGFGYKYISSPFEAATVNELSDDLNLAATFATVYAYDEDNHSDSLGVARDATGWTKYITPSGILTPMKGFAANFGSESAAKTIAITGVVNNDLSSPLTLYNHNRQYTKGFNLVGNPYPSPIDWNASSGWTKTNIDNAVYYFDAGVSSQYTGTYSSYANGVSSNGTAVNIIPAMQGFFVHVTNGLYPVTAYLGMGNPVRVNNLSSVFHKSASADTKSLVRLTAEYDTEKIKDAAVVYFDELATTIFDKEFDALKLMNTDNGVPNLYSVTTETDRLSISAIPYPADSTTRIPLGLKTEKADWVTLNVTNIENIPSGLHIYLEDALTGLVQDMQINPEYRVHIEKGTLDSRFTLIFSDKDLVHAPTGTDTFFATLINGRLSVTLDANSGYQSQLMISNMPGQVMHRENLYGSGAHEIDTQLPAGIYVLTIYGQKGICSQKIYIPN